MDINNNEDYEKHVRSNESIRDGMDGVMKEPKKEMSRENDSSTSNNNTSSEELSRG